ncbi:ABC transporter ATP-binding protein [Clostridium sp. MSJ-11]|uniref:ABC transporter ATP-binding protein n=1 Tax=Clostridium mobile TaxID=2841512 RepID=A0ABS6EJ58_9CLOT|nr:ABC transporter ATP-binding protein [Clostridium mobile]MBU5484434.1 ABC transporter ATP-binding protein [Clostridium mobile]
MKNVIEVEHLKKSYNNKLAVDNLSFSVKEGEFFGLLGHNGAGKSTTIDCILGLKSFENGKVRILDMDPIKNRKKLFERVGVQLQQSSYQDRIKVLELCEETSVLYKEVEDYQKLLKEFSLDKVKNQYVSTLSGGEKQKLAILLALLPRPEVIFLDELTTGLDTAARRGVWKQLSELKEKRVTLLLTSHYMDEVEVLCDKICIIKNGKEVVSGTVQEVISTTPYSRLEEAYLWYMGEEEIV